jgi:hypothetical protein
MSDNGKEERDLVEEVAERVQERLTPPRPFQAPRSEDVAEKSERWPKAVLVTLAVVAAGAISAASVGLVRADDAKVKTEEHDKALTANAVEHAEMKAEAKATKDLLSRVEAALKENTEELKKTRASK